MGIGAWLVASTAQAGLVDHVLVIRNLNSSVSQAVANDYMARRGASHVLDLRVQDAAESIVNETILFPEFQKSIEKPLKAYLAGHPGIDFILLTKGIPIRLDSSQGVSVSLDSYLASMDYDSLPGAIRITTSYRYHSFDPLGYYGTGWSNRFWNSRKRFSHAEFGGYLVTRLDGYSQADAIALTTRSLAAEAAMQAGKSPTGKFLLDEDPDFGQGLPGLQPFSILASDPPHRDTAFVSGESDYGDWNTDLALAADTLRAHAFPYLLDTTWTFQGHLNGLMGYASWGSNDHHFSQDAYATLGFDPGGIAETAVSTSARSFIPFDDGGQSRVADLIQGGVTGVKGYVNEPLIQAIASPSILFGRYTEGWTLAESFYAASNLVGWEDIIIGDPIARAYPSADPYDADPSQTTALAPRSPEAAAGAAKGSRHEPSGVFMLYRPGPGFLPVTVSGRIVTRH